MVKTYLDVTYEEVSEVFLLEEFSSLIMTDSVCSMKSYDFFNFSLFMITDSVCPTKH